LLTDTKIPRSSLDLAATIRSFHDDFPVLFPPIMEIINGCSEDYLGMVKSLESADGSMEYSTRLAAFIARLGYLCDSNHCMLNALGAGHPAITTVWEAAKRVSTVLIVVILLLVLLLVLVLVLVLLLLLL
jgi:mevalonate kinase